MSPIALEQPKSPVQPGNETGIYYIIVAGLPFNCSWQDLKDFARAQRRDGSYINIDRAMVYPKSTNGWVRVKGNSNFRKAFTHLNGGVLGGRSLLADDRNEKQWTSLKDMRAPPPKKQCTNGICSIRTSSVRTFSRGSSVYSHDGGARVSSVYSGPETYPEQWSHPQSNTSYTPASPAFSAGAYSQQSGPIYEVPPNNYAIHQPEYCPPPPGHVFAGDLAPATPIYASPPIPVLTYMVPPPTPVPSEVFPSPNPLEYRSPELGVKTEARKIIITKLPHGTDEASLGTLLRGANSSYSGPGSYCHIQALELAHHADGAPKGHAFAVFEDAASARRAVQTLNGSIFLGRRIQVRLAKEGARPRNTRREDFYCGPPAPPQPEHRPSSSSKIEKTEKRGVMRSSSSNEKRVIADKHTFADNPALASVVKAGGIEVSCQTPPVVDGSSGRKVRRTRSDPHV